MSSSVFPEDVMKKIISQISELYVRNDSPEEFIQRYNGHIFLCDFLCFTYGSRAGFPGRVIEVLYFLSKSHSANQIPYEIALYDRHTNSYHTFWVENTGVLRKDFLKFTKKTHLFRNTFLYDPKTQNIFRLHELKPYLHLPFQSILGKKIWTSQYSHYVIPELPILLENTLPNHEEEDTAIVPKYNKYKQILDLCDELNCLIKSCH